jgi:biopolymer transport protein ExbD
MKFPRNARIYQSQFDVAPFAGVFFLLTLFVLLGSLVYTPGVQIHLPTAADLPGTDRPLIAVAVDANGRFYFDNQLISPSRLRTRLAAAVNMTPGPITLLVQADKQVDYDTLIQLSLLARDAGIQDAMLATLPQAVSLPFNPTGQP